jgi:polar amino acid transport system substrate-binding protein
MVFPLSPSGMTRVQGEEFTGMLPDILRKYGKQYGCEWQFSIAPRARIEAMFEAGQSDVIIGATRTPRRDQLGYFIPIISTRAAVLSLGKPEQPVKSFTDIVNRRDIRVALVRGLEFGDAFDAMVKVLTAQKRVIYESSPLAVVRLLDAGIVDVTIMTPISFAGMAGADPRYAPIIARLRIDPVDELPWSETGAYIAKDRVTPADRTTLETLLGDIARAGVVQEHMKAIYPANVLRESVR